MQSSEQTRYFQSLKALRGFIDYHFPNLKECFYVRSLHVIKVEVFLSNKHDDQAMQTLVEEFSELVKEYESWRSFKASGGFYVLQYNFD